MDSKSGKCLVIMAVDNSTQAEDAFDWYAKFIHQPDNDLIVVHVHELHSPPLPQMTATPDWKRILVEHEEKVHKLEAKYHEKLKAAGLTAEVKRLKGKPGECIVHEATDRKAGLVVLGTRGLGTLRRTIMGSVSSYVMHHAHCPVLICRKPEYES